MPARPLADATLHLIDAVRTALAQRRSDTAERPMFGCWIFFVDGKICIGVKGDELLVRLPPERHGEFQEMQNTRELSPRGGMRSYFWIEPNGYASSAQWAFWLDEALAYNPRAKATPPRKKSAAATIKEASTKAAAAIARVRTSATARKRHSIFEADD